MAIERLSINDTVTDSTSFAVSVNGVDRRLMASSVLDYVNTNREKDTAFFSSQAETTTDIVLSNVAYPVQTTTANAYNVTVGAGITVASKTTGGDDYNYFSGLDVGTAYKVDYTFTLSGTDTEKAEFSCYSYTGTQANPVDAKSITMNGADQIVSMSTIVYGVSTCALNVISPVVAETTVTVSRLSATISELGSYTTNL